MKKLLIIASLILSIPLMAQEGEDLRKKDLVRLTIDQEVPSSEIIEKWNHLFDHQHLERDRFKHRMNWRELFPIRSDRIHNIKGRRIFYGISERAYRYDIIEDVEQNKLIVNVKIHFRPSKTYLRRMKKNNAKNNPNKRYYPELPELMRQVESNVALAQGIWNKGAPEGVEFKFEKVEDPSEAHYSIKLVTKMGALYDRFIMAPAYSGILAHEVGHMMGLDDEYSLVTSSILPVHSILDSISKRHPHRNAEASNYKDMRCNLKSIMCLKEVVYPYHLDHILGRIQQ